MSAKDEKASVAELKRAMLRFAEQRDWLQFHTPKNLAMGMAIEAAELMEHFQWLDAAQSQALLKDRRKRREISDELADVLMFVLQFANVSGIDLASAMRAKLRDNARKYPVRKARGSAKKYTEL